DVVAPGLFKIEHDLRKFSRRHFRPFTELAGLEILTEDATQVAPAEKDCARSIPAAEAIFFAEMRKRAGDSGEPATFADAELVVIAVNLAIARTDLTGAERIDRFGGAFLKNTLFESTDVSRHEIFARQNKSPTSGQLEGRVASGVKASTHGRGLDPFLG